MLRILFVERWRLLTLLFAVVALQAGFAYSAAKRALRRRAEVNASIAAIATLGDITVATMTMTTTTTTTTTPSTATKSDDEKEPTDNTVMPLAEACRPHVARDGADALAAYVAEPTAELHARLPSWPLPRRILAGTRWGDLAIAPVDDARGLHVREIWWDLFWQKPWKWDAYVEQLAQRGPDLARLRYLAVAVIADAEPPRISGPREFQGGTSTLRVRVITTDSKTLCEGEIKTMLVSGAYNPDLAKLPPTTQVVTAGATQWSVMPKFETQIEVAPLKALCWLPGDPRLCGAVAHELEL